MDAISPYKRKRRPINEKSHKKFKSPTIFTKPLVLSEVDLNPLKGIPYPVLFTQFKEKHKHFIETLQLENSVLKVKTSPVNSFGNYPKPTSWNDPRMFFIKKEWIAGRKCLDIGCGNGTLAISLAKKHKPDVIVGCDIDLKLVKQAVKKSKKVIVGKISEFPKSFTTSVYHNEDNVLFVQENYIASMETEARFDTIICFSVIPWIHLNYGDVGVEGLFYKVYGSLKENGVLLIEEETMAGYKKKKRMSSALKTNFKKIAFFPEKFEEFLTEVLGFKLVQKIECKKVALKKNILVLQKI